MSAGIAAPKPIQTPVSARVETGPPLPTAGVDTLVVGPGDRFLSGVSYYTALLATALDSAHRADAAGSPSAGSPSAGVEAGVEATSVRAAGSTDQRRTVERGGVALLQLRELCPRRAYPGRARVGRTDGVLPLPDVPILNGLDWYWGRSALRAVRFLRRARPRTVVLQWWTGTVLHSYLPLAWLAKRGGARLVIEFHEVQDVGEARVPLAARYARVGMRLLLGRADAAVVHSGHDRDLIRAAYPRLRAIPTEVIPHGPLGDLVQAPPRPTGPAGVVADPPSPTVTTRARPLRLLIFGVIRPYKGHAELAEAIGLLRADGHDVHLTVVGEVWQDYRAPLERLGTLLPPDRLQLVDRYVADEEVGPFFAAADMIVLPYHRASASGPLQLAMSLGLPVVTTAVGGLTEAVSEYSGAVLAPPRDPVALAAAIMSALPLVGTVHEDPHSWKRTAQRFRALFDALGGERA